MGRSDSHGSLVGPRQSQRQRRRRNPLADLEGFDAHQFYTCFPQRFSNKTNGISHRRWLIEANPKLASLIDDTIGDKWRKTPARLSELMAYKDDASFKEQLAKVKTERKEWLARYIKDKYNQDIRTDSIFDIQIKRIHLYKRQTLNILHILHLYFLLKDNPSMKITPRTYLFGGKAAAATAKQGNDSPDQRRVPHD